jgi:cell division protein FtsN
LATTSIPRDGSAGLKAQEDLQLAYDKLASETEALRLENKTLTDTVAGLETQLESQQLAKPTAGAAVDESVAALYTHNLQTKPTAAAAVADSTESRGDTVATTSPKPIQAVTTESPAPAQTAPAPAAAKPIEAKPAVAAASGPWFVNFGSYATRNMAESWAARLQPGAGKVIIMPNTSDGRTLYRVRIVGLADRESANQVARKLEAELRVAELWVGRE